MTMVLRDVVHTFMMMMVSDSQSNHLVSAGGTSKNYYNNL